MLIRSIIIPIISHKAKATAKALANVRITKHMFSSIRPVIGIIMRVIGVIQHSAGIIKLMSGIMKPVI